VNPTAVKVSECHGTGTELGDPIEVGALKNTYGAGRAENEPLVLAAVKSNIAHLEGAAGVAGLIKLTVLLPRRQVPPNIHLRKLNPHIDLEDFVFEVPGTSALDLANNTPLLAGLSSFGFGGTNTHLVLAESTGAPPFPAKVTAFRRQAFPWQKARHPLLKSHKRLADGSQVFMAPFAGRILQLVSHHIIFGEIVVPGATYIEMLLAAGENYLGTTGQQWSIEQIGFQSPLVLKMEMAAASRGRRPCTSN
jgi:acyl transferase domain-containing protein